jgi:hypothetical protein
VTRGAVCCLYDLNIAALGTNVNRADEIFLP